MSNRFVRLDAAESAFFERQLEFVKAKTYDIRYPDLLSRRFIPVSNETPSGAKNVTYRQYDRVGKAKIIQPGATDIPRVDVFGKEFTRPVRWGGSSYGWNLIEIREAQLAGLPLDRRKAEAARRADEELLDEVAAIGAPEYGIATGFINDAGVTVDSAGSGVWSSASADNIIADVATMWTNMVDNTKGIEKADTLLLPDGQYALIATKPRSTVSDTTVLEFIMRSFPGLNAIEPWYRLKQAGAASKDRAVLYRRSADHVEQEIVNEFEQLPVYQRGSNFEVETLVATAGTNFYYPRSCRYMDGI